MYSNILDYFSTENGTTLIGVVLSQSPHYIILKINIIPLFSKSFDYMFKVLY